MLPVGRNRFPLLMLVLVVPPVCVAVAQQGAVTTNG